MSMPTRDTLSTPAGRHSWAGTGLHGLAVLLSALLASCAVKPPAPAPAVGTPSSPAPSLPQAREPVSPGAQRQSVARSEREYRKDAAAHLYALNGHRIYKGRMPPMLQAVGVLDVDLDRLGQIKRLHWRRAPRHAPEVMAEIERTVRAAAPFPVAQRLGALTYTDVWLWHKSGRFQLDTLTEGQD